MRKYLSPLIRALLLLTILTFWTWGSTAFAATFAPSSATRGNKSLIRA